MQRPFFYGMSLFGLIDAMGPSQAGLTKGHDGIPGLAAGMLVMALSLLLMKQDKG